MFGVLCATQRHVPHVDGRAIDPQQSYTISNRPSCTNLANHNANAFAPLHQHLRGAKRWHACIEFCPVVAKGTTRVDASIASSDLRAPAARKKKGGNIHYNLNRIDIGTSRRCASLYVGCLLCSTIASHNRRYTNRANNRS